MTGSDGMGVIVPVKDKLLLVLLLRFRLRVLVFGDVVGDEEFCAVVERGLRGR